MAIKVIQPEWNSLGAGERQLSSLTSNGSMLRHCPKPGGTATPTLPDSWVSSLFLGKNCSSSHKLFCVGDGLHCFLTSFLGLNGLRMTGEEMVPLRLQRAVKGQHAVEHLSSRTYSPCGWATANEGLDPMLGRSGVACFFPNTTC